MLAALAAAMLRLLRGRPGSDELSQFALTLTLAFIDGFMVAYLAPFIPVFASRLSFHLFLYMLLLSLTSVLYASYRAAESTVLHLAAMAPWFFILVLVVASSLVGSRVVFLF